jgi:glycine amidinotransferase/scyllo-inosamine-4-phosphate amidinotransferase 1
MKNFGKVNSHNEWDPLKEVIVGRADGSVGTLTWLSSQPIPTDVLKEAKALAAKACPEKVMDEVKEDLDGLSTTLQDLGVTVHRPIYFDQSEFFSTPFWQSNSNNCYNARDLNMVVGDTIIESPSMVHSRYYETTAYYDIFDGYMKNGCKWIAAPKPVLNYETLLPLFDSEIHRELTSEEILHKKLTKGRVETLHKVSEREILFEAANTLRMGKDLLYLLSSSGNKKGAAWLQAALGNEYRVHTNSTIYKSSHIDSTVLCLRPGLVLLNSTRVNNDNCPEIFSKWDKLWFGGDGEVAPTSDDELNLQKNIREPIAKRLTELGFKTNLYDMSSPWVGLNFLSVSPDTVLVESRQTGLIKLLESHKFTVVPVQMRHMYTQGGGIHCATLDTVRDSKLENYFD